MADPVSISFSLQQLKCTIQCLRFYQQETADATNAALIASLTSTYQTNENTAAPAVGMPSANAQSASGGLV